MEENFTVASNIAALPLHTPFLIFLDTFSTFVFPISNFIV